MSKINIKVTVVNAEDTFEYKVPAIYQEDEKVVIYKELDEQNTSVRFNYVTKELVRENDSLIMNYIFNKEKRVPKHSFENQIISLIQRNI